MPIEETAHLAASYRYRQVASRQAHGTLQVEEARAETSQKASKPTYVLVRT